MQDQSSDIVLNTYIGYNKYSILVNNSITNFI